MSRIERVLLGEVRVSQQDMKTTRVYQSYRLYSLSTEDCVHLMVNHSRNAEPESDTADLRDICNLVGNVPFASKILAITLFSGTSAKYIIQELSEKAKLKIIADKADKVGKDRLLSAIELAFQFVKKECQISTFLLIKFHYPFTLDEASPYITADMMSEYFNYTDFEMSECLLELSTKSFLEIGQYSVKYYSFHELIVSYLNSKYELLTEILQTYWKYYLHIGVLSRQYGIKSDDNDFDALTQIVDHDNSFSFEASIALMINFPYRDCQHNLSSAARVLVSYCKVQDYNSKRLNSVHIIQGYTYLLQHVICQEEFPTDYEWNCMDAISLCLPIIEKHIPFDLSIYIDVSFSCFILRKCQETGSSYGFCESVWKHSLYIYATYESTSSNVYMNYDFAIHYLHLALEDTSSPHDLMTYMILYTIYSRQNNPKEMEKSLAGIHKLDFQQIDITCYISSAGYEDPHGILATAILFFRQVNKTKLADKLRSKLFLATYAKMGCCASRQNINLMNSLSDVDLWL